MSPTHDERREPYEDRRESHSRRGIRCARVIAGRIG